MLCPQRKRPAPPIPDVVAYYSLAEVERDARCTNWAVLESSPQLVIGLMSSMQIQQSIKIDEELLAKIYLKGKTTQRLY